MITTPVSIRVSLTFLAVFTFIFRIPSLLSVVLCFFYYTIPHPTTQQQSAEQVRAHMEAVVPGLAHWKK
mgnify:CR=1 FL=1